MEYGRMIHLILSKIKSQHDIATLVIPSTTSYTNQQLTETITTIIQHPLLQPYFTGEGIILNEQEIILPNGTIHRPDRIVIINNHVAIIDYKTGQPHPSHEEQINTYAQHMQEMGYPNTKKILVYIDLNEVVEIQ